MRTLVDEHTRSWDFKLAIAELAYNTTMNRTTRKSSHQIVYGFRLKQPIDLIPMSDRIRASDSASSFTSHIHDWHKKVIDKIAQSNVNYNLRADIRKRFKTFNRWLLCEYTDSSRMVFTENY